MIFAIGVLTLVAIISGCLDARENRRRYERELETRQLIFRAANEIAYLSERLRVLEDVHN